MKKLSDKDFGNDVAKWRAWCKKNNIVDLASKSIKKKDIPKLFKQLESENRKEREQAADKLKYIEDKRVIPALMKAMKNKNILVQVTAIELLGYKEAKSAIPALIGKLKHN